VREFIRLGSPIEKQKATVDTAAGVGSSFREQKTTDKHTRGRIQINWKSKEKAVYRCTHRTDILLLKRAVM
jgi:hypothetical protein